MTEHLPIQRWDYDDLCAGPLKFKGEVFVTYDDHVAALRACEERVIEDQHKELVLRLTRAYRDEIDQRPSVTPFARGLHLAIRIVRDG